LFCATISAVELQWSLNMPDGSDWPTRWDPPYYPRKRGLGERVGEFFSIFLAFIPGLMIFFIPVGALAAILFAVCVSPRIAAIPALLVLLDIFLFVPVCLLLRWLEHRGVQIG
jgi:hypothetical protein